MQIASPACTELEMKVLDWLADMLGLPDHFKFCASTHGGGVIHGTASEATLVALLVARSRILAELRAKVDMNNNDNINFNDTNSVQVNLQSANSDREIPASFGASVSIEQLVGYCSDQAHSSVARAGMLGGVTIKPIQSDDDCRMRGNALKQQILDDVQNGLVPFLVVATLGTTNVCTFDDLDEVGAVCREFNLWLHVDAAYAGNSFVCPENRYLMRGIEVSLLVAITKFYFNKTKTLQRAPVKQYYVPFELASVCRLVQLESTQVVAGQL